MKVYLIYFIVFLSNISLFSQYKEGYIIENNNDTIFGLIAFEGSIKNSTHCSFKSGKDSMIQIYYPENIKAFRFIESKYFVSANILVDNNPKKVFLEWLIKGKASILSYSQPDINVRYFILLDSDSLYELQNTSTIYKIGETKYDHVNKEYVGTLLYYFKDCPSISNDIKYSSFTTKSLIKIAKKYHEKTCKNEECIVFEDKHRKLKYEFGLTSGLIYTQLKLNSDIPDKVHLSQSIGNGIVINVSNLPLISQKFSLHTQIMYFNTSFSYDGIEEISWTDDYRICGFKNFKIPLNLTYKLLYKKLSPFISLGVTGNFRFDFTDYNNSVISYITRLPNYSQGIRVFQLGYNTELGLAYQFFPRLTVNLGFDYEYSGSFLGTYVPDNSYSNNLLIQVSILHKMK